MEILWFVHCVRASTELNIMTSSKICGVFAIAVIVASSIVPQVEAKPIKSSETVNNLIDLSCSSNHGILTCGIKGHSGETIKNDDEEVIKTRENLLAIFKTNHGYDKIYVDHVLTLATNRGFMVILDEIKKGLPDIFKE